MDGDALAISLKTPGTKSKTTSVVTEPARASGTALGGVESHGEISFSGYLELSKSIFTWADS
jgi:hypothetical protein